MTHVITGLCLRDAGCATVCPVECIVPGNPTDKYPWFYIDPDTCIDCGACVPECPYTAIFPEDEVPTAYKAKGGEYISMPKGTAGYSETFSGKNHDGGAVTLDSTHKLAAGETIDLTPATESNASFFKNGPGYKAAG